MFLTKSREIFSQYSLFSLILSRLLSTFLTIFLKFQSRKNFDRTRMGNKEIFRVLKT